MAKSFSRSSASSSGSSEASHRLVSSRCPECGAPVDFRSVPSDQTQVKCSYCGTLITIPGRSQPQTTDSSSTTFSTRPNIVVSSDGKLGNRGCSAILWTILILVFVVGTIAVSSASFLTSASRIVTDLIQNDSSNDLPGPATRRSVTFEQVLAYQSRLSSAPILLGGNELARTQIVVSAYQPDGYILLGFDPVQQSETWRSPLLSEQYYEMGISADLERVFVADGAKLMALDRSTGALIWQSSLANNIQTGCDDSNPCLQQVGEQIVALTRDGTIQGFAGATGAPLWSRRLNSQPRQFLVNNDQVIVIDNDTSNRAVVFILNGVNGDLIHELQPSCTFPNIEMRPHSSDQYLITPDGSALIIVSSGTYACAWRFALSDGALVWNYISPGISGPLPFTWSMSSLTIADPVIYFIKEEGDDVQIYALDSQLPDATPQILYAIQDYELTLLYPLGDLLLVSAQPSYARDEIELWAIDRSTGERRWQRKLETKHTFDKWVTHPTDQGIFLSVCFWNVDECRFELLDMDTGTSKGQVRQEVDGSYVGAAWRGNQGFLTIDGKLYVIDLTSAQVNYTWP